MERQEIMAGRLSAAVRVGALIRVMLCALFPATRIEAACIDGKWDPDYTWIKDCTPNNPYDGWFPGATAEQTVSGDTQFTVGSATRTLSWRLHWFKSNLPGAPAKKDSLPLILGLHPWTDGATIDQLLGSESSLMQYEGGWEDLIFLTVALENGNNLGTWWDGTKIDGTPTTWAMDAIVGMLQGRIRDACGRLGVAGATALSGKHIDTNRVYLIGTSMGGSGAYHIGIRHPEIFAAFHANAGFADYNGGPCGNEDFCLAFTNDFIGTAQENLQMKGLDGQSYPARSYSDMSWFAGAHNGASWTASLGKGRKYEPPYVLMTHGKADVSVDISSANRLADVLKRKKFGYSFLRHTGGHSNENFAHLNWLLGFRKNRSYPALTNNSTDITTGAEHFNFLDQIGWVQASVVDQPNQWQVQLTGSGTVDITPRRLQRFAVSPNKAFHWWLNDTTGVGKAASADSEGNLTLPAVVVSGPTTVFVRPDSPTVIAPKPMLRDPRDSGKRGPGGRLRFPIRGKDETVDGLGAQAR
jgi:pimeloyl-ACP methyl ester carboxylesterase